MSLVLVCATYNRIVMKCDGHSLPGEELQENRNKIERLGEDILVGYTGNVTFCQKAMVALQRLHMLTSATQAPLPELVEMFQGKLKQMQREDSCESSFLVAGKKDDMYLIFGLSSANDFEIQMQFTTPEFAEDDTQCFVIGDKMDQALPTFETYFREQEKKPIESIMNGYILRVAELEDSVSDVIFTEKIK